MTDFEKVTDFNNLYKAFKNSKSGKGFKESSARFDTMALEGVLLLQQQIKNKEYKVAAYNEFEVTTPKRRLIKSCSFKDKVVQHSLCDNVLIPISEREFITENFAGQIGKGTLFGLDHLRSDMLEYHKKKWNRRLYSEMRYYKVLL